MDPEESQLTTSQEQTEVVASPPPSPKTGRSATSRVRASMSTSKTKWIVGGSLGLGGIMGILGVLFFLLLFKNVHIKNLFLDYEFAKYNRAFRNRLEQAVNDPEANPNGTAESTVQPTDSPEVAINDVEASKIKDLKTNSNTMEDTVAQTEAFDQSTAGSIGSVDGELGIDSSVPDESGKSDTQAAKDTNTSIKDEIAQGETAQSTPNPAVKDAVDEASKAIDEGAAPAATAESAGAGFARGLNNIVSKATGPFLFATIGCIARDIYVTGYKAVAQIKFAGLAKSAATVNKYADCQKLGKCSLAQIGAVSKKFDNGSESFTQSAAYQRAAGQPVTSANPDLDPNMRPVPQLGGSSGLPNSINTALSIADNVNSVLTKIPLISSGCAIILNPTTQIAAAVANVGIAIFGVATDTVDFGASTVAQAAVTSAGVIFASKAGKALALDAALHYGGLVFKQNFSPVQWGNMMGAGDKALATSACAVNGCRPLTQPENTQLALAIHADDIKTARQKGIAYRLFSPKNPTSTLGLLADRTPSSPGAMTATIGRFFATLLNPGHALKSMFALINPARPAWAADISYNTYGIPDYGFTDAELNQWGVVENSRWVQQYVTQQQKADFDKCFDPAQTKTADLLTGDGNGGACNGYNDQGNANHTAFLHYRLYKLDQRVTQDLVLLNNNQGSSNTTATTTTGGTGGCINPFTDPGWALNRIDQGVDYDPATALPVKAICDGQITSTIGTLGSGWPGGVYMNIKISTPGQFQGKCYFVAEHLTNYLPAGTNVVAGQTIATALPGSPNTEWGWSQGVQTPATQGSEGVATEGGKAFDRFIASLGGPNHNLGAGPLYAGATCP